MSNGRPEDFLSKSTLKANWEVFHVRVAPAQGPHPTPPSKKKVWEGTRNFGQKLLAHLRRSQGHFNVLLDALHGCTPFSGAFEAMFAFLSRFCADLA